MARYTRTLKLESVVGNGFGAISPTAAVSAGFTAKIQAGKIIPTIAPIVGGKGGGKDAAKLAEALVKAKSLL